MYAVIFTSQEKEQAEGYDAMAERMDALTRLQPGFVSIESARNEAGFGITVCCWETLDALKEWKKNLEHKEAQVMGREKWYESYRVRICTIEEEYGF